MLCFVCFCPADVLSISKAKHALRTLGIDAKSDELSAYLDANNAYGNDDDDDDDDSNNNNNVQKVVTELMFVRFGASKILQMEKAQSVFELIDKDQKGVVVLEDLERIAHELDEDISREELEEMIELVDRQGDGLLTINDFVRIAKKIDL